MKIAGSKWIAASTTKMSSGMSLAAVTTVLTPLASLTPRSSSSV